MFLLRWVVDAEIVMAVHLGALGSWWAASAARRARKLSGECSVDEVLK